MKDKRRRRLEKFQTEFDLENEYPEFKGWEAIGFHRPLGRELWQIIIEQINNALFLFIMLYLIPFIQPFPEIVGYNNIAGGLFGTFYVIFDTGTNFGIYRFIAEYRIKDPKRMLEYISFYIRYQMMTGIVQVTLLSWYTFGIIRFGNYAYLTWMLLIILQKQWPGMLGIFKTVLSGFQHHAKVEMLNLMQGQFVERITMIGFILVGRWIGATNAGIGIIMGICIFTHLGNYIDDIIFGFISGYYVNKILKKYMGLSLRDVFRVKISKSVLKEMLFYGIQGSLLPILGSAVNTYTLITYTSNIPAYVSWASYIAYGSMFSGIIGQFGDFALSTSIAESYSNGKKKLAEFYVSYTIRWRYFFYILIAMALLSVIPYFIWLIDNTSVLEYYRGTTIFFIPLLLRKLLDPLLQLPDPVMYGALKITAYNIIRAMEEILKIFFLWFFIFVIQVQYTWGTFGLIFLLGYTHIVPYLIKSAILFIYVNKKVMKIKIYWKSTILGPTLSALPVFGITQLWYYTGFPVMVNAIGPEVTIGVSMFILFIILIFIYFPLNVLIGGWDDYMFHVFKKAIDLSGPSKPIFMTLLRVMAPFKKTAQKLGSWNNPKWTIPFKEAHEEIRELMDIKRKIMGSNLDID
ncbi:MAG: hypothetical protein ACTSUE_18145 [Promethearchaeota archaeon]